MGSDPRLLDYGMTDLSTINGQALYHGFVTDRPSCMYSSSPESSPSTPENKYYKMHQCKENRDMMCKRRLDFSGQQTDYLGLQKPPTVAVARRNERERNRVKLINMTFATLREHIPSGVKKGKSKKMSKVDTLKAAIDYIRFLQEMVDEHDAVNAVLDKNCQPKPDIRVVPASPSVSSPTPSISSDTSHDGAVLSAEEEDLLDFTNWF
ncbi:hypothetical protein FSP39_024774 [Pinctada imbricata]|uniref:BHLH domain-containing protein n=1 Tax=Pinctada imbricata TaxID=66713 RepID=A0AA89BWI9_PINIB|nr:hypothetical protein FSP39_024774 [Pinctada imbricata]